MFIVFHFEWAEAHMISQYRNHFVLTITSTNANEIDNTIFNIVSEIYSSINKSEIFMSGAFALKTYTKNGAIACFSW